MSGPDFRHAIREWAPWYMKGRWGGILLDAVGTALNSLGERAIEGRDSGNPLFCQEDALLEHAKDVGIDLYPNEPAESRRYRLSRVWQLKRQMGTDLGILANLQPYFLPGTLPKIRAVHTNSARTITTWWTRNSDGTLERHVANPNNWDWDGTNKWARTWVIIYTEGTILDDCPVYGDATLWYANGEVYGGLVEQVKSDLIRAIKSWRAAHEHIWGVALARDSDSLDPTGSPVTNPDGTTTYPTGNWLYPVDPTTGEPTRLPSLQWIYDRTRDGA